MFVPDNRADALHFATALELHARTCRANGLVLPVSLAGFAARCWEVARGDSDRQEPTPLAELVTILHGPPMQLLLAVADVAKLLDISKRSTERLIADGTLPSVTIGANRRVRRQDVEAYVDSLAPRSFRADVESKAPASPSSRPAGRRTAGGGARSPARASSSQPSDAA